MQLFHGRQLPLRLPKVQERGGEQQEEEEQEEEAQGINSRTEVN